MREHSPLDEIRIASPCQASWDAMPGDDRRRHCSSCGRDVFNLSALTADAALALVAAPGPRPCVRFFRRLDGTMLTADCPVGVKAVRRRRGWRVAGVGVLSAVAALVGPRRDVTQDRPVEPPTATPDAELDSLIAEIEGQNTPTLRDRAVAAVQDWVAQAKLKLEGDDPAPPVMFGRTVAPPVPPTLPTHLAPGFAASVTMGDCMAIDLPAQTAPTMNNPLGP